jgi:elongation factor Tu
MRIECRFSLAALTFVALTTSHPEILLAQSSAQAPFLLPIEDTAAVSGGTQVEGMVQRGMIKRGDSVEIIGFRPTRATKIVRIMMAGQSTEVAKKGSRVGLILDGVSRQDIERGQIVSTPGTIKAVTKFSASAHMLRPGEGGRSKPFSNGYRPQFLFWVADITGKINLPAGKRIEPGDNFNMTVELILPAAVEKNLEFTIRESGKTIGSGVVTAIID